MIGLCAFTAGGLVVLLACHGLVVLHDRIRYPHVYQR